MSRFTVLALILLVALGLRTTWLAAVLPDSSPVSLAAPLSELPMNAVGPGWSGQDVPLDEEVAKKAKVSAYIQRNYERGASSLWFYVGYVGKWSPESIHHPDVCFPGSGFELTMKGTITIPCPGLDKQLNFKEFLWTHPRGGGTYTLSTFYYNGKFEPDEWKLRLDSLLGIRYFVIITVSGSQLESIEETRGTYQEVLRQAVPGLLPHFASVPSTRELIRAHPSSE